MTTPQEKAKATRARNKKIGAAHDEAKAKRTKLMDKVERLATDGRGNPNEEAVAAEKLEDLMRQPLEYEGAPMPLPRFLRRTVPLRPADILIPVRERARPIIADEAKSQQFF
jgi:hypothetical protein